MPSDCPFREEVLREVEEMRKRKEEEKEQRRFDSIKYFLNRATYITYVQHGLSRTWNLTIILHDFGLLIQFPRFVLKLGKLVTISKRLVSPKTIANCII